MKWFKHYTDASNDDGINRLEQEFGYEGYGVYWKIIELCALKWDGKSKPIFTLNRKKIRLILSLNYVKTELILSLISELKLFNVVISEFDYSFEIPKLLEIKDNHARNLQVAGNKVSTNLPLDKNRTDKNRTDKKGRRLLCEDDKVEIEEAGKILQVESNILTHLNAVCLSSYRPGKKTIGLIKARLADGFTYEDFKTVIESKHSEWIGTDWAKFLRPETLFGNKFEGYLQSVKLGSQEKSQTDEEVIAEFQKLMGH